jgi:uncharacterized protein
MRYEWDEGKNASNFKKHGISFEEASTIFEGPVLTSVDENEDRELREISFGLLGATVVLAVVHTDRFGIVRIISARKANKNERKLYHVYLERALGGD